MAKCSAFTLLALFFALPSAPAAAPTAAPGDATTGAAPGNAAPGGASPLLWLADPAASAITVHAGRLGPLAALSHEHHFAVGSFRAEVQLDPAAPERLRADVVVDATSLHDQIETFGETMRGRIDRSAAGPEGLDAARFPQVRFQADKATLASARPGALEGVLHGQLTLHGQTHPLDLPFHAWRDGAAWRATGEARFAQSAYGITPARVAGGAIRVADELTVSLQLLLHPAEAAGPLQARRPPAELPPAPRQAQGGR